MAISGNVTTEAGVAADLVRIFRWPDKKLETTAVPDAAGDWTAEVTATGDYGITYLADGCQPVTHGPYLLESSGDPHWNEVISLLHFEGDTIDETGQQWEANNAITFSETFSAFGKSLSANLGSGVWPLRAKNVGGRYNLPGAFTIELRFQHSNTLGNYRNILVFGAQGHPGGISLSYHAGSFMVEAAYVASVMSIPQTISRGQYYWLTITRDPANMLRVFLDGTMIGSVVTTEQFSFDQDGYAYIGNHPNGAGAVGEIDELRITKGVARYTENFTPPTSAFPNY